MKIELVENKVYFISDSGKKEIHLLVKNCEIPSTVLFLEHENVYTLGKNAQSVVLHFG